MSSLSSRCRISMGMSAPFSAESVLSFLFNLKYCLLVYFIILKHKITILVKVYSILIHDNFIKSPYIISIFSSIKNYLNKRIEN